MRIAFYMAQTWPWTAEDLEQHGAGGAETAMGNIARAFARAGHDVTIFNAAPAGGTRRGVRFRPAGSLAYDEPWDVFVSLCHVPRLAQVRADVKVHWCMEQIAWWVEDWNELLPAVDAVFTVSPYHTALCARNFGLPPERLYTTCCAIDPEEYRDPLPKVPNQLIYCSLPNRGAHHLPPIFRLIRERVRDATLVVTSDLSLWGYPPGMLWPEALFSELPGARYLGRVPRPRLVELQKRSVLHLYPCVFQELFCLSSAECQAAGAPTVTSDLGALPTTVDDGLGGRIVPLGGRRPDFDRPEVEAFTPATHQAFADCVVGLLARPGNLQVMRRRTREHALRRFGADAVAPRWLAAFAQVAGRRTVG